MLIYKRGQEASKAKQAGSRSVNDDALQYASIVIKGSLLIMKV